MNLKRLLKAASFLRYNLIQGILFTVFACFCWSLVFVIPSFLPDVSPLLIALGRFFFYGLFSFCFTLYKARHLFSPLYVPYWKKASYLSLLSTLLCYTCSVFNIKYTGPTAATLLFAMVPICIAWVGNWYKKEFPSKQLALPLGIMLLGIFLSKIEGLEKPNTPLSLCILGFILGICGLASWTWFAVKNAAFLKNHPELPSSSWGLILGSTTFFYVLLLTALYVPFMENPLSYIDFSQESLLFLISSFILGTISTWLPFFFWNKGSKRLPISLTGQLMISEIIFALLFIYIWESRSPSLLELMGISFMIGGVFLGFNRLKHLTQKTELIDA